MFSNTLLIPDMTLKTNYCAITTKASINLVPSRQAGAQPIVRDQLAYVRCEPHGGGYAGKAD